MVEQIGLFSPPPLGGGVVNQLRSDNPSNFSPSDATTGLDWGAVGGSPVIPGVASSSSAPRPTEGLLWPPRRRRLS